MKHSDFVTKQSAEPADPSPPPCVHKFVHWGVVYTLSQYANPGGSARNRTYEDKFFCEHCLKTEYINARTYGTSFDKPIEGSFPK